MNTTYTLQAPRVYRINDLPDTQNPYERLESSGSQALSLQELLAIVSGNPEGLITHVQEYGMHSLTALTTTEEAMHSLKLSSEDAARLIASIELGKRLYSRNSASLLHIQGINDVFTHYRSLALLPKEQLRALLINSRYQLVHEEVLAMGSIESLHITARDVFQAAIERRVTALILIHNHPSGDPTPSKADLEFTKEMRRAGTLLGIQLLDHVIIAERGCASCMPEI